MNNLKKYIILHIMNNLGVLTDKPSSGTLPNFVNDKFIIDKKMVFETEDGSKFEKNIFAAQATIEKNTIKLIIADITEEDKEFSVIIQMDNFLPLGVRLSLSEEDEGTIVLNSDKNWVPASVAHQAKMLLAFENMSEVYLGWSRLDKYEEMYKLLIGFLNDYEKGD